ncbi:MAG: molybdopterin-dependent oxidoreductase [Litoreibacter sp.]
MSEKTHFRVCNLCEAMCGIAVDIDGEKITVKPDANDPFSKGSMCPKAPALAALQTDPDRLRYPVKKVGDDWQQIGWDEAYALVADGLRATLSKYGPNSVGTYLGNPIVHNLGMLLFVKSLTEAIGSQNVFSATSMDQLPHHFAAHYMFGHEFRIPVPDIDQTDHMIIMGANPIASNGSIMTSAGVTERLRKIEKRGGKVVVIDPRRTETAKIASAHHFIKPGQDVYFLLAFVHILFRDGHIKLGNLEPHLKGFEMLEGLVAKYSPQMASPLCGLSIDNIETLVIEYAEQDRAVLYGRMGLSTQPHGGLCHWLINLINILSGNFDVAGGMMFPSPAIELARGVKGVNPTERWKSRVRGLPEFYGELPVSTMAEEMEVPGHGQIKAFMTICGNPVLSSPGGKRLDSLLPQMDFMVSIDNYINETTRHADVILPTPTGLEVDHYDMIFNIISVANNAKFTQSLMPVAGDRPFDWEVLKELIARMGGRKTLFHRFATPRRVVAMGLALGPYGWLSHPKRLLSGLSLRQVIASGHGIKLGPLQPRVPEGLRTADGKIDLAPGVFLNRLNTLEPETDDASFRLIGRRNVSTNNSWMHQFEKLSKSRQVRCTVMINPDDAHALDIEDSDVVRVTGRTDTITLPAEITDTMMPGVLSIPHGFGHTRAGTKVRHAEAKPGVSVNDITDHMRVDPLTGNAAFSGQPVSIERAEITRVKRLAEGKPLTILYASQTGNAEALAYDIAKQAETYGMVAQVHNMAEASVGNIKNATRLLVICATYGEGDMPDAAVDLWQEATRTLNGILDGVPFAVLALGDQSYEYFAKAGRDWDEKLAQLGGAQVAPVTCADVDYDATAKDWAASVLPEISSIGDQTLRVEAQPIGRNTAPRYNRRNPGQGTIVAKRELTSDGSTKEVMHYEISLDSPGLNYTAGDTLNILPENDPKLVTALLKEMGCEGNERVGDYHDSLRELLTHHFEIRIPSTSLLDHLSLGDDGNAPGGHDILDLVSSHRKDVGEIEDLIGFLRPLSVRSYSISSSPVAHPNHAHLTVVTVRYDIDGRSHGGTGSTYLADRVAVGAKLKLYVTPNVFFSLPKDPAHAIIMVGPGTGIAPFRGFLQERSQQEDTGDAWLFFGDRNEAHDFLYRSELSDFKTDGVLTALSVAFSRDNGPKVYVQDQMRKHGAQLWQWLDAGAIFYVCGDGKSMAPDVETALLEIIKTHGNLTDADGYLEGMRHDKRYLLDVY